MNERRIGLNPKRVLSIKLENGQVMHLTGSATFDGVAIAEEIHASIATLLKIYGTDQAFRNRVKAAYLETREKLSGLERGTEIIDALGDPLNES